MKRHAANLITLLNLCCGMLSLFASCSGRFGWALILICLAVLMDNMDGRVARALGCSSELGRELDSLCDVVSFGVAPALMLWLAHPEGGWLLFLCGMLFAAAGAFRLARFNVTPPKKGYDGLPIPVAGAVLALLVFFLPGMPLWLLALLALLLAVLMVSRIPVPKF